MANKIFKEMLHPQAQLPRNGFDRSALRNFTAKIGELLPIMCIETVPNSHYEIKVSDLMRTIPLNHASFVRASQHFEFYFVPYQQIWRNWDNFYTTRSVPTSAIGSLNSVNQAAPNASLYDIYRQCYNHSTSTLETINRGDIGEFIGYGAMKVANLLGYGGNYAFGSLQLNPADYETGLKHSLQERKPNLLRAAAYQKICFDYYRQPFYDLPDEWTPYQISLDDAPSNGTLPINITVGNTTYDNRLARLFQLHYRQWKKDLFTGVLPSTQFGAISVVNTGSSSGETIPLNLPLTAGGSVVNPVTGSLNNVNVSFKNNDGNTEPYDDVPVYATQPGSDNYTGLTAGKIQDGHSVSLDGRLSSPNLTIVPETLETAIKGIVNSSSASGSVSGIGGTGSFNVLSLVRAQAVQRWREVTLRSGFRNTSQYQGHFGVTPIFTEKDRSVFIDSVSSPLQINSVVNQTAYSQDNAPSLGDLAANGTSVLSSDKTIRFDAKDFGVIMCIYSMLPEATYMNTGLDLMNQKVEREDFFIPEYENIGMEIMPMSAFRLGQSDSVNGYVPRYSEYKANIDTCTPEFSERFEKDGTDDQILGAFYGWCPQRTISLDWQSSGIISPRLFARDLYVNPLYFASVFSYSATMSSNVGDSHYDHLVHQCYFDVKCIQPMSVLGLPHY